MEKEMPTLKLISHALCPYVQRAAIALTEKGVSFERIDIDLSNKPAWFLDISPLGKTPVLLVDGVPVFESSVILEFLEDTQPNPLHPGDPLERARHRSWIEFGSSVLNDIAALYNAADATGFATKVQVLQGRFERVEADLSQGPYFAGSTFSLVDAAYGPIFRYFDVFEQITNTVNIENLPKIGAWRAALASRPSVKNAVSSDYNKLLKNFLLDRNAHISRLLQRAA